jgi:hypothetical protein
MKKVIEPRNKRLEVMKQNKRGKNTKKKKRKKKKKKKEKVGLALIWNHCTSTRK